MVEPLPDFVPPIIALVDLLLIIAFFALVIGLWRQRRWMSMVQSTNILIQQFDPNTMTFRNLAVQMGLTKEGSKRDPKTAMEFLMLSVSRGSIKNK